MDAALGWARLHGVAYHLKLRFPDGFRFEERWAPEREAKGPLAAQTPKDAP
jgi:hypothetical protein